MISVRVHGVGMSPYNQGFVALLMDDTYNQWLPIYIGSFEAQAIAMELDDVDPPRPMTHDLLANVIDQLGADVAKVVVSALKDSTYYAEVTLRPHEGDEEIVIDARPSDSIALALRTGADVYVAEDVMEEASVPAKEGEEETEESRKLKLLQSRLQRAVEEENFEEAADLRDQIKDVQREIREEEESADISDDIEEELAQELGGEFHEVDYEDLEQELGEEEEEEEDDEED